MSCWIVLPLGSGRPRARIVSRSRARSPIATSEDGADLALRGRKSGSTTPTRRPSTPRPGRCAWLRSVGASAQSSGAGDRGDRVSKTSERRRRGAARFEGRGRSFGRSRGAERRPGISESRRPGRAERARPRGRLPGRTGAAARARRCAPQKKRATGFVRAEMGLVVRRRRARNSCRLASEQDGGRRQQASHDLRVLRCEWSREDRRTCGSGVPAIPITSDRDRRAVQGRARRLSRPAMSGFTGTHR